MKKKKGRLTEKRFLEKQSIAVAPWHPVRDERELDQAIAKLGLPLLLKTTRFGYDGKGQFRLSSREELSAGVSSLPYPLVAESIVDFVKEISVMVARNAQGQMRCFAVTENRHKDGILDISFAPAQIPHERAQEAQTIARKIAESLSLIGILGVEMFVSSQGSLLVNEMAPRPHNSGHWTMNGCAVDQFEMHIRAVAGLPLPAPYRHSNVLMKNLIGASGMAMATTYLDRSHTAIHLYGKTDARDGRKMGHINTLFPLNDALDVSAALERFLTLPIEIS